MAAVFARRVPALASSGRIGREANDGAGFGVFAEVPPEPEVRVAVSAREDTCHVAWTVRITIAHADIGPEKETLMAAKARTGGPWAGANATSTDAVRAIAMKSLFERLEALCEGAVATDLDARVIWINTKYAQRLGLPDAHAALGRPIEEIIPNSRMREVVQTGDPIVLDILDLAGEHCVVTRMPLCDESGTLIGAVGFVLYERVEG
jgi:transcriptional regulator with PAS, ATPase and Fis domain